MPSTMIPPHFVRTRGAPAPSLSSDQFNSSTTPKPMPITAEKTMETVTEKDPQPATVNANGWSMYPLNWFRSSTTFADTVPASSDGVERRLQDASDSAGALRNGALSPAATSLWSGSILNSSRKTIHINASELPDSYSPPTDSPSTLPTIECSSGEKEKNPIDTRSDNPENVSQDKRSTRLELRNRLSNIALRHQMTLDKAIGSQKNASASRTVDRAQKRSRADEQSIPITDEAPSSTMPPNRQTALASELADERSVADLVRDPKIHQDVDDIASTPTQHSKAASASPEKPASVLSFSQSTLSPAMVAASWMKRFIDHSSPEIASGDADVGAVQPSEPVLTAESDLHTTTGQITESTGVIKSPSSERRRHGTDFAAASWIDPVSRISQFIPYVGTSIQNSIQGQEGNRSLSPLVTQSSVEGNTHDKIRTTKQTVLKSNMLLPAFDDIFAHAKRKAPPKATHQSIPSLFRYVTPAFGTGPAPPATVNHLPHLLPLNSHKVPKKCAIIGIHGWYPNTLIKSLFGAPTGTSTLFAAMMDASVRSYLRSKEALEPEITLIPLEGEGKVNDRVEILYQRLTENAEWCKSLTEADAIFVVAHSQGVLVSVPLLLKVIADRLILPQKQDICLLAMAGVNTGPLAYLHHNYVASGYLTYFENEAAHELFEFQDTDSKASQDHARSLARLLHDGIRITYIASLDDQLVPVYSALNSQASHPNILRALYIDGKAYDQADFLINLLVFVIKLQNAGIDPTGICIHVSEAVAGALTGVGHSTIYNEAEVYTFAVRYLLETSPPKEIPPLQLHYFNAREPLNFFDLTWHLRGMVENKEVCEEFGDELHALQTQFESWSPTTRVMKEIKKRLEPLRLTRSRTKAIIPWSP